MGERRGRKSHLHNFCNNDIDLAIFLPKLKKYNGLDSLEKKLQELNVPSGGSVLIIL